MDNSIIRSSQRHRYLLSLYLAMQGTAELCVLPHNRTTVVHCEKTLGVEVLMFFANKSFKIF